MTGKSPSVSICIPAYNAERYIAKTIESVLSQSFTDYQLLVVDDSSTDKTTKIVSAFDDPRITLICNQTNLGPQKNWNKAISIAAGEYIKLLHQDDLLGSECVATQVATLAANPNASLVSCDRKIIDENGMLLLARTQKLKEKYLSREIVISRCVTLGTNIIGEPSAALFLRDLAIKIGGFSSEHSYLVDLDFWLRLLNYGDYVHINEALVSFRVSRTQWSARLAHQQEEEFVNFMVETCEPLNILKSKRARLLFKTKAKLTTLGRLVLYKLIALPHASELIRTVRFVIVGLTNTLLVYLVFALFITLNVDFRIATGVAGLFGVLSGYVFHKKITFSDLTSSSIFRYSLVFLVCLGCSIGIQWVLNKFLNHYASGAIATIFTVPISYLLNRFLVFRR